MIFPLGVALIFGTRFAACWLRGITYVFKLEHNRSRKQSKVTPDVTVCADTGSFGLWLSRYLQSFEARQYLVSNGQQTLGTALPWAIAASLVRPSEKILSISGDGGFLFSAMELETAVRLKFHFVHMIWIDGSYNMVGIQEEEKYTSFLRMCSKAASSEL